LNCDIWYEKIDGEYVLSPEHAKDQQDVLDQIFRETGLNAIPISAPKDINMDILDNKIMSICQSKGKDLLYAKATIHKDRSADAFIKGAAATAATIGFYPYSWSRYCPFNDLANWFGNEN
jgi:translation initiation factor 2 gamma subunit (eIF-2gamma)